MVYTQTTRSSRDQARPFGTARRSFLTSAQQSNGDHRPKFEIALFTPAPNIDEIYWLKTSSLDSDRTLALRRESDFGGAGYNMAMTLGQVCPPNSVAPLFPVGTAGRANDLVNRLAANGIVTSTIVRRCGRMRKNLVLEFTGGQRRIVKDPSQRVVASNGYAWDAIADCGMLAINGSLPAGVLAKCIKRANRLDIPWCWNPAVCHFEMLRQGIAKGAELLQMNVEEATALLHAGPATPAQDLVTLLHAAMGARNTVITCGKDGAWGSDRDEQVSHAAAPRLKIGKAVGMGDRFFALSCWILRSTDEELAVVLEMASEQLHAILREN